MAAKVIKVFSVLLYFLIMVYAAAQENVPDAGIGQTTTEKTNKGPVSTAKHTETVTLDNQKQAPSSTVANEQLQHFRDIFVNQHKPVHTSPSSDLVSSFRSSVRFGGFWDKYVIINFTPDIYLKPVNGVSLYASHLTSLYVPLVHLRSYFNSLAAEGIAVAAVEGSLRLLRLNKSITGSLIGFVLKNVLMAALEPAPKQFGLIKYRFYYYSINIVL